jgi:hypothetical protein
MGRGAEVHGMTMRSPDCEEHSLSPRNARRGWVCFRSIQLPAARSSLPLVVPRQRKTNVKRVAVSVERANPLKTRGIGKKNNIPVEQPFMFLYRCFLLRCWLEPSPLVPSERATLWSFDDY